MRFAFYSTMTGASWGGSEELWSRAAAVLLSRGHAASISFLRPNETPPQIERLKQRGADVHWRSPLRVVRETERLLDRVHLRPVPSAAWLRRARPDFLLISAGSHLDDLAISRSCRQLGIAYGILVQAAGPHHWINARSFESYRAAYQGARRCYFVSQQNREVVESNLALDLSEAEVVDNAFNVSPDASPAYPATVDRWKLACVARIHFQSKGQDLLVHALKNPKWRSRPLEIVLWGEDGRSLRALKEFSRIHGLDRQLVVGGYAPDIEALWREHHGLILPSRYEGNSLAMIEAMLCGRVPIVTNVGRAAELVDDNRTGFVAPAATAADVDDALERAWRRRHEWQAMGALASQTIRDRHSLRPAEDFADALLAAASRAVGRAASRAA